MNNKFLKTLLLSVSMCSVMVVCERGYGVQQTGDDIEFCDVCTNIKIDLDNKIKIRISPYSNITNLNIQQQREEEQNWHPITDILNQTNDPMIGCNNVGATCYMNATLQAFSKISRFVRVLL